MCQAGKEKGTQREQYLEKLRGREREGVKPLSHHRSFNNPSSIARWESCLIVGGLLNADVGGASSVHDVAPESPRLGHTLHRSLIFWVGKRIVNGVEGTKRSA